MATLKILLFPLMILPVGLSQEGWAPMGPRVYDAPRVVGEIAVDGILDDPGWAMASWTEDFVDILGRDAPTPHLRTRAKILWDETYLYVGAELDEPDLWATLLDRDAIIYRDDDFEVFLDPGGDGRDYFEIEINPHGTVLDLFLEKPYREGGRAVLGWDVSGLEARVSLSGTLNHPGDRDDGWSVEMAIPWKALVPPEVNEEGGPPETPPAPGPHGNPPKPGDSWRINFSRVDWPLQVTDGRYRKASTPSPENQHPESNWVWSPQGAVNMHLPEMWGVVRFVIEPQNSLSN